MNPERDDYVTGQTEMFLPPLGAGMKDSNHRARFRIDRREVRSFAAIAIETRKRQILTRRCAAVLLGNRVVSFVRSVDVVLVNQTVFAATLGSIPDGFP